MNKIVRINADLITDWESFHNLFSKTFGFFKGYGRNMDAWIDCMTDIDDPDTGMTKFWIKKEDILVIELFNSYNLKTYHLDIFHELLECVAFVNQRKLNNHEALIAVTSD